MVTGWQFPAISCWWIVCSATNDTFGPWYDMLFSDDITGQWYDILTRWCVVWGHSKYYILYHTIIQKNPYWGTSLCVCITCMWGQSWPRLKRAPSWQFTTWIPSVFFVTHVMQTPSLMNFCSEHSTHQTNPFVRISYICLHNITLVKCCGW